MSCTEIQENTEKPFSFFSPLSVSLIDNINNNISNFFLTVAMSLLICGVVVILRKNGNEEDWYTEHEKLVN